jgi:N-acetylgalactosamine-N,N'-diacetylbacillosaminyl-diphospho-undecaprenol 4-alpha-N-acetylgalactosaminyltransferase
MSADRNIVFIINSLEGGGAERILVDLLHHLQPHMTGYRAHLVLLDDCPERYPAPSFVTKHVLGAGGSLSRSVARLTGCLRRLSPVATISFLTRSNAASIAAAKVLRHPCIVSERVHTSSHFSRAGTGGRISKALIRLSYPLADHVVAVSEGVKSDLVANFGVRSNRVSVIYNPVDVKAIEAQGRAAPSVELPASFAVSVGRLVPNKNFSLLIEAYARSGITDDLVILGEGPERPRLEELVAKLNLGGRVHLPGYAANPHAVVGRAAFFVSASNAEGFPNALVEAMVLGRPVLATDCDSGPLEILSPGRAERIRARTSAPFGILVPTNDLAAMTEGLRQVADPATNAAYGTQSRRRAESFGVSESVDHYWRLIEGAMRPGRDLPVAPVPLRDRHLPQA